MLRVYYHYDDLEEYRDGMWRIVRGDIRKACIERAGALMRDSARFEAFMREAISKWPKSCAAAFTAEAVNKIAWLGHAGCCLGAASPEEATRGAWHTLNSAEQDAANEAAARALSSWIRPEGLVFQQELELARA